MAFVTKIRVSFRVMRGNRNLCPLEADLHGAMFASNVACHKMLTAESFSLGRTYLELACNCHVHSRAGLEACEQQPSLVGGKNYWRKLGPSYFS